MTFFLPDKNNTQLLAILYVVCIQCRSFTVLLADKDFKRGVFETVPRRGGWGELQNN